MTGLSQDSDFIGKDDKAIADEAVAIVRSVLDRARRLDRDEYELLCHFAEEFESFTAELRDRLDEIDDEMEDEDDELDDFDEDEEDEDEDDWDDDEPEGQ